MTRNEYLAQVTLRHLRRNRARIIWGRRIRNFFNVTVPVVAVAAIVILVHTPTIAGFCGRLAYSMPLAWVGILEYDTVAEYVQNGCWFKSIHGDCQLHFGQK